MNSTPGSTAEAGLWGPCRPTETAQVGKFLVQMELQELPDKDWTFKVITSNLYSNSLTNNLRQNQNWVGFWLLWEGGWGGERDVRQ